jgi:hypothetical protein
MTPAKMKLYFAFFPYSGSGGVSSQHPSIQRWFVRTMLEAKKDERIAEIYDEDLSETPITMTRNRAVQNARKVGADVLIMCDSDQWPDLYHGQDPLAKPFFPSSFDFLYKRRIEGHPVVVGAPYCGPPNQELVYVFKWANWQTDHPNVDMRLEMFTREEAAVRSGIEEVAALPTGLIMFDMQVFDTIDPPYFYYEYTDAFEQEKASTEDVTCTRDLALHGVKAYGRSPIHCNWDSWAGHMKPKCVGKPKLLTVDHVSKKYQDAVRRNQPSTERLMFVRNGDIAELVGKP